MFPVSIRCVVPYRQSLTKHALAAVLALSLTATPVFAAPSELRMPNAADAAEDSTSAASSENVTPIYFGNGCFWGRQKDFVDKEKALGRDGSSISAITGYAGGQRGAGVVLLILPYSCRLLFLS